MKIVKKRILIGVVLSMTLNAVTLAQNRTFRKIQKYVDKAVEDGLVGVNVYIKDPKKGILNYSSGHSNVENKQKIASNHVMYLASISKTYCAVAIVLAQERGLLDFDDNIDQYLPSYITDGLPSGHKLTIRHLLNMSSGLFNYEKDTTLNNLYLSGNLKLDTVKHLGMIEKYVFDKEQYFEPGTDYNYSSTNYLLLMKILDRALGYPHQDFISQEIIKKHKLNHTYYKNEFNHIQNLVEAYGDLNHDGLLENISDKQWETTAWFVGDDGLLATTSDTGIFMEKLLTGNIVSKESLDEMTKWIAPKDPDYGMGLMYDKSFPYGEAIGHSGVAIGATSDAYYFPKQKMTVVVMTNTGKRVGDQLYKKAYNKLLQRMILKLFVF